MHCLVLHLVPLCDIVENHIYLEFLIVSEVSHCMFYYYKLLWGNMSVKKFDYMLCVQHMLSHMWAAWWMSLVLQVFFIIPY